MRNESQRRGVSVSRFSFLLLLLVLCIGAHSQNNASQATKSTQSWIVSSAVWAGWDSWTKWNCTPLYTLRAGELTGWITTVVHPIPIASKQIPWHGTSARWGRRELESMPDRSWISLSCCPTFTSTSSPRIHIYGLEAVEKFIDTSNDAIKVLFEGIWGRGGTVG